VKEVKKVDENSLYINFSFWIGEYGDCHCHDKCQSVLDAWWKLASIFSGGMLGFFAGLFVKKVKSRAAIAGMTAGVLLIGWMSLSPLFFSGGLQKFASPFHSYLSIVFGTSVIFLVGFLLGVVLVRKNK
jgi:SSS family solute:Na+ symporter